ncbi:putative CAP [Hibiscus syriacus]|uniref:CAP n=1 Tax=Hibiscus syriacus TaxID=106335 RepID=A0A6A2XW36_HIBSY|nr:putative CAP [Hibiscus syriacus]
MESSNDLKWRKQSLKPIETMSSLASKLVTEENENSKKNSWRRAIEPFISSLSRTNPQPLCYSHHGWKTRIYPDIVKANLGHTLLRHPRFSSLQPLWDLHLLNLRTSESEAVGILRVHHSLGDGISLMSLLLACTRQTNDPLALPTIPVKKKQEEKDDDRWFWRIMFMFWSLFQVFRNTLVDVFMIIVTTLFLQDTQNPLKGPPGALFNPRRIVYRTVSLDDIKLVKNAVKTTINDVALGFTQAGLSRYINRIHVGNNKDEGAIEKDKKDNLPKKIRLRSTLVFNLIQSAGIKALADMMEKDSEAKWGICVGYVLLPFTIALRDDPLDYVRDAKATIDRKKRSFEAIFTSTIVELTLKLFGVKNNVSHNGVLLVGPLEEIDFYGHPLAFLAPGAYGQPHASLSFEKSYTSYVDKMAIVLSVDEGTIPNPHQVCEDMVESLRLIKDAVVTRGLA